MTNQILDIEKKTDNSKIVLMFQNQIQTLDNKCNFMDSNFSKRIDEIQAASVQAKGAGTQMVFMPANNIDPNRFCILEKEIKKIREESDFLNKDLTSQIEAFKIKMNHLDENLFSSLNQKNLKNMVSQDQLKEFSNNFNSHLNDKLNQLNERQNEQNVETQRKLHQVREIEKSMNKIMKEFDFKEMMRQLSQKCEEIEMQKQVRILEMKISNEHDQGKQALKDIQKLYKICQKMYDSQSAMNIDDKLSIGTQKIVPLNCLGCGSISHPIKRNVKHRGLEGKIFNKPAIRPQLNISNDKMGSDEDIFPMDQSILSKKTKSIKRHGGQSLLRPQSAKINIK